MTLAGRMARPGRCLDSRMATDWEAPRVVSARRDIAAEPETIFELIAQVSAVRR
jgi:hypothetical protein